MSICSTGVSKEARKGLKDLKPLTVTLKTARQLLGIGNTKLYELVNDGTIETITVGRRRLAIYARSNDWRYRQRPIKRWLPKTLGTRPLLRQRTEARRSM